MTSQPDPVDPFPTGTVDAVVVGGGAAGLNSALMLARSRRSVVVVDSGAPRNAPADAVHGFLVLDGMSPTEVLRRGREQVRSYGGRVVAGEVVAAAPLDPAPDGDLRFRVALADGRTLVARRVLVATGLRDVLPDVPGLAEHWGRSVVHCPYCHGFEVRDQPLGILAAGPASLHHAWLFRQLSDDVVFFSRGLDLDAETRARFAARDIRLVETEVAEVVSEAGELSGVRLVDGTVVPRRAIVVGTRLEVRSDGLDGLGLPLEELPGGLGRRFASGMAGTTSVPGVWVAGNATEPMAQVGAAAAAGTLAGAHLNADLATTDTDLALAARAAA